jgi:hypothetical protein
VHPRALSGCVLPAPFSRNAPAVVRVGYCQQLPTLQMYHLCSSPCETSPFVGKGLRPNLAHIERVNRLQL